MGRAQGLIGPCSEPLADTQPTQAKCTLKQWQQGMPVSGSQGRRGQETKQKGRKDQLGQA